MKKLGSLLYLLSLSLGLFSQQADSTIVASVMTENTICADYRKADKDDNTLETVQLVLATDSAGQQYMYRKRYYPKGNLVLDEIVLSDSVYTLKTDWGAWDKDIELVLALKNATLIAENKMDCKNVWSNCSVYQLTRPEGIVTYYAQGGLSWWVAPTGISFPAMGGIVCMQYPNGTTFYMEKISIYDRASRARDFIPKKSLKILDDNRKFTPSSK